jgi:PAS domain S-box-containing protein
MEVGGITGKPRFTISQRLTGDDGSFRGVVVAGIYSSYFADVYREASLDPGARFSLSTTDGRLLASWPESSANTPEHGVIKAERTLARLPVIVSVVLPKGEVLAGWRNRAIASGAGVLVVIAACGALTRLGHRSFARESAALDRIAAINRDLESKVAERTAALASSENELRALYDTAPVGMCMFDLDLRFLRVNKRLAEINGIDARDHIGRTVYEVVPALASQAREIANKVIETGEPVLNVDFEGETPAAPGARRSWNESWVPLKGQDGRIVGINVVAEETTAKKRAEKKIMALLAETQRLSQYNELAAREMSHRVMNSFQLLESLLVLQERRLEDTVAKQALDLASTRVRAMSVVQRRLFHATRGDVTTVDLGDYLRDLCEELARAFAGDRCTVSVDAEHGIVVSANEGSAVAMIATELVINACKYAFSDGDWGRISVRLAREQADGYRLEVNDNGRGLPADFALGGSKGVGTRIVNSMASQLKAKLEIDRTGPGARFIISVPGYIAGLMKPKEGMQASTVAVAGKHHDSG